MDKEELKRMAENPRFISGIHNYCDRWCEKCPFTSRCMNYALCDEQFGDPEANDINNKKFWDRLSEIFKLTLEMVKEDAAKMGVDIDSIDFEQEEREEKRNREIRENNKCVQTAKAYYKMTDKWFVSNNSLFEEKADDIRAKVEMALPGVDPEAEFLELKDAVEVIRWYEHQIYVKLKRAVSGTLRNTVDEDISDANGSAKVALLGIDNSIAAWGILRNHLEDQRDLVLDILLHLSKLRKETERTFPGARAFIRLGFDK
jgi:hypothetical protein